MENVSHQSRSLVQKPRKRRINKMPKEVRNDMDFKRVDMRKSELHRHMEQEKKLKDAIAFDDCPCTYSCCKLGRKCCGQGYCDNQKKENKAE